MISFTPIRSTFFFLLLTGFLTANATVTEFDAASTLAKYDVTLVKDDALATEISIDVSDVSPRTKNSYITASDHNDDLTDPTTVAPGWPELPMITRTLLVPPRAGISLNVKEIESRMENDFEPYIVAHNDVSKYSVSSGIPSEEYLNYEGFWPPDPVVMSKPSILRGHRLVQVSVYPMQYNPRTKQVRYNERVSFELTYEGEGENIVEYPNLANSSVYAHRALRSLVDNPERLPRRDDVQTGSYLCIYPDRDGVWDAIEPLIEWRKRQGHKVILEEVESNHSANDIIELIEDYYFVDEGDPVEFVCLIGDADGNPRIKHSGQFSGYGVDGHFAVIDGNDDLPDVALGRLSAGSNSELENIVRKIVTYEADPNFDDDDSWSTRGCVIAGATINGLGSVLVAKYVRKSLLELGYEEVSHWYHTEDNNIAGNQPFLQDAFDPEEEGGGISIMHYRAYQRMNNLPINVIFDLENTDGPWPPVIAVSCNTGDFVGTLGHTEAFLRSDGGGIGAIGTCTPLTHVQFNNINASGVFKGIFKEKLYAFGWGLNMGKYELWKSYETFNYGDPYLGFMYWNNLMGDPASHIFTGAVQRIDVQHSETISVGESAFQVLVSDYEDEVAMSNALVCLYKTGEDGDELQLTAYTDEEGVAEFHIPSDALSTGELMVTVTKHNVVPYLGETEVVETEYYIGAESWEINDGDNDAANPGDELDLSISLMNFGSDEIDGPLTAELHSLTRWAEVISEEIEIENVPEPAEAVNIDATVRLDSSIPDGVVALFDVVVTDGNSDWRSTVALEASSPELRISNFEFSNEGFGPGEVSEAVVELKNIGSYAIGDFSARMVSLDGVIGFVREEADYAGIDVGDSSTAFGNTFRVTAHPMSIPGMMVEILVIVEDDNEFIDTANVFVKIGQDTSETEPFGPDEYGYVCFDNSDVGWEMAPVYDWIEISPSEDRNDFDGEELDLRDSGDNQDESTLVELPFTFQYYGVEFDELTVCTNGWAAFGDQVELADFRNRQIGQALGPNAHLAVWWDNLKTDGDSEILTYYDSDGGRFIVEWYKLRRLLDGGGSGATETFQLILYDVERHPTYSGDGIIEYQYKDVENESSQAHNDHPYCTIGMSNLDDSGGLQYTYWNQFHPGAKSFPRNVEFGELAIKFTTATTFITGVLTGQVKDAETGDPIEGAEITTSRGFFAVTDSAGMYYNSDILIGEGYVINAWAQGYNDSTFAGDDEIGFQIFEDETTRVNFDLLHPEFNLDREGFELFVWPDSIFNLEITLSNDGNGSLDYTSKYVYVRDEPEDGESLRRDDLWDEQLIWHAGDSLDNNNIRAIEFANGNWIAAGDGYRGDPHQFYYFDRNGNFLESFDQPIDENRGIYDMAFHDGVLYAVGSDDYLHLINPENAEQIAQYLIPEELNLQKCLAVDSDGNIYISSAVKDIYVYTLEEDTLILNRTIQRIRDPRIGKEGEIQNYGLAWFKDEPDGYNLFINYHKVSGEDVERALFKYNPETNEARLATEFAEIDSAYIDFRGRSGLCITPKWNNLVWVVALVLDDADHDGIGVFELGPNSSWLDYQPREGQLDAGENVEIDFSFNSSDLDWGHYGVDIRFMHNADSGWVVVPVDMDVGPYSVNSDGLVPLDWSLEQNYPNPFNPATQISFSLKESGMMKLSVFDLTGREVEVLSNEHRPAGSYRLSFNANQYPGGMYFYRLEAGDFVATRKMVLVK